MGKLYGGWFGMDLPLSGLLRAILAAPTTSTGMGMLSGRETALNFGGQPGKHKGGTWRTGSGLKPKNLIGRHDCREAFKCGTFTLLSLKGGRQGMQGKVATWVVVAIVVVLVIVGVTFLMLRRSSKVVDVGAAEREKLLEMEKRVLEGKGQATTAQPPR